jgi:hypothetical protein
MILILFVRAVNKAANGPKKRAFYWTSRRQTAVIMMEIQRQSQDEKCPMLKSTKEEFEVGLSRIGSQCPEDMYIPQEHKDPPLALNFGP